MSIAKSPSLKHLAFITLISSLASCSGGGGGGGCAGNLCTYPGLLEPNSGWTDYGTGTGAGFTGRLANPWTFPAQSSGKTVNYVYTAPSGGMAGKTITLNYSVDGNAVFAPLPESNCGSGGCGPAKLRLFIWANNDTGGEFGRWWCNANPLVIGDNQTVSCTVTPGLWIDTTGTSGAQNTLAFTNAVNNPFAVGFTFGGEFAGHGVWVVSGQATFRVNSYTVQ